MELSNREDVALAAIISLVPLLIAVAAGDPLYIGLWYYLVIPAFIIGIGVLLDAPPPYVAGASLAAAASLLGYMSINLSAQRPEGFVGLAHLLSLPGAVIGFLVAMRFARRSSRFPVILALGCLGWGVGFLVNRFLWPYLLVT